VPLGVILSAYPCRKFGTGRDVADGTVVSRRLPSSARSPGTMIHSAYTKARELIFLEGMVDKWT